MNPQRVFKMFVIAPLYLIICSACDIYLPRYDDEPDEETKYPDIVIVTPKEYAIPALYTSTLDLEIELKKTEGSAASAGLTVELTAENEFGDQLNNFRSITSSNAQGKITAKFSPNVLKVGKVYITATATTPTSEIEGQVEIRLVEPRIDTLIVIQN